MSEYAEIRNQSHQVTELFKLAEMAKAYRTVTEEHGPSQQLIDFINHDGKLGEEIGLEGFSNFSTQVQHELLLSKLNCEQMSEIALESMTDFIKKFGEWLVAGGAIATLALGPGALAIVAAGGLGVLLKRAETKVPTFKEFKADQVDLNAYVSSLKSLLSSLPGSNDKVKWEGFTKKLKDLESKVDQDFENNVEKMFMVEVSESGWTPGEFVSAAKWYEGILKEIEGIQKKFSSDIEKLKSDDLDNAKAINAGVAGAFSAIKGVHFYLKTLKNDLDKVAKCYEVKK